MATVRDANMIIGFASWWRDAALDSFPDWESLLDSALAYHANPANGSPWLEEAKRLKAVRDTRSLQTGLIGGVVGTIPGVILGRVTAPK